MRNLHKFVLDNNGIEVLRLLWDWERLQYRECDYKNHRIFTLRCIHNDLVPVSIKLKSTFRTERAKKILRSAEKQLLQARLKSINSLLDNNTKQIETTRSKIASILPISSYRKCQEFIDKVKELRFSKVKERQVRKFNNLLSKKEGNITCISIPCTVRQAPPAAGASPTHQPANRQAALATRASTQEANNSQAGRQVTSTTGAPPQLAHNTHAGNQNILSVSPQSVGRQASLGEDALAQAESTISQGSTPQSSLAGRALHQAEGTASGKPVPLPRWRARPLRQAIHM